jgi:hypothetical protein
VRWPDSNTPGRGHENGDVEQAHRPFKRAVAQTLLLHGSRDFASPAQYVEFLQDLVVSRNRGRHEKLQKNSRPMQDLRSRGWRIAVPCRPWSVGSRRFGSAINLYSAASRLMGETVDVRLYPEQIEVRDAGELMASMERQHGKGHAVINYAT